MITLKELKERKQVRAKRINHNFIPDEERIANFENRVKAENLQILEKEQHGQHIDYVLLKAGEHVYKFNFASWHQTEEEKEEFLQDIIKRCDLPVLRSYRDNEFAYVVTDGEKIYYTLALNNPKQQKEIDGTLYFRSNDYYFEFITKNPIRLERTYGDVLRANQIQDNKIIVKLGDKINIEYVMEL